MTSELFVGEDGKMAKKQSAQDEDREAKAYDALLKYLTASPRSEKECREKLYQKGFHKNEVEYAVDRAKRYRYINDEEYVRVYLSYYGGRVGKKLLAYKLTQEKGIDRELAQNIVDELIDDERELEKCGEEARKYAAQKKIADRSGASKVYAHLVRKGYDSGVISKIMATVFDVVED